MLSLSPDLKQIPSYSAACMSSRAYHNCNCLICLFLGGGGLFCFLGPYTRHMEVPRLQVQSELQLPACTTAMATWDPSCVCHLHHSSGQHRIFNPPREARNQSRNLMAPSWIRSPCATTGTPHLVFYVLNIHLSILLPMFTTGVPLLGSVFCPG